MIGQWIKCSDILPSRLDAGKWFWTHYRINGKDIPLEWDGQMRNVNGDPDDLVEWHSIAIPAPVSPVAAGGRG